MTFDLLFLEKLQSIRTPFFDAVFTYLTYFGSELIFIVIFCFLFWCVNKNHAYKIGLSLFMATFATQIIKIAFAVPRPWMRYRKIQPVEGAIEGAGGYSFPSAHCSGSASFYGQLCTVFKKRWFYITALALILLVAFSRLYLGVHTPQDVIFGLMLGGFCILVTDLIWPKIDSLKAFTIVAFIGIVASIAGLLFAGLKNYGIRDAELIASNLQTFGSTLGFFAGALIERKFINYQIGRKRIEKLLTFVIGLAVVILLRAGMKFVLNALFGIILGSMISSILLPIFIIVLIPLLVKAVKFLIAKKKIEPRT